MVLPLCEGKKSKVKQNQKPKQVDGIRLTKPALNLQYRKVDRGDKPNKSSPAVAQSTTVVSKNTTAEKNIVVKAKQSSIPTQNTFDALYENDDETKEESPINDDSDEEQVDEVIIIDDRHKRSQGASTSFHTVSND